jgi:hypothetical protein
MPTARRRLAVSPFVMAVVLVACSSTGPTESVEPPDVSLSATVLTAAPTPESSAPSTQAVTSTDSPTSSEPAPSTAAPDDVLAAAGFEQVAPGGDCQCADGGEYSLFVRDADPTKVMLYFQGGGACFSAETCSFTNGSYVTSVDVSDAPIGRFASGIFDLGNPDNPLADHSIVFVPYCTGDVFLGDASHDYGGGLTVQHKGFVNASAGFAEMLARFPDATEIFVTGSSAGGIPVPLFAGKAAETYPDARVVGLSDASGAYPDVAAVNAFIGGLWNSLASVPDWPTAAGATAETWSIPGLFSVAGRQHPDITLARYDNAYDEVQAGFSAVAGVGADDLLSLIDANEQAIEADGVDLAGYVAPGDDHTILMSNGLYDLDVSGVRFLDWLTALVEGQPVDDVRCDICR